MIDTKPERGNAVAKSRPPIIRHFATRYLLALIASLFFSVSIANSKERSCNGVIYATPGEIIDADGNPSFGRGHHDPNSDKYYLKHEKVTLITGKGSCILGQENKKCRKNAADRALKCARAVWSSRWDRKVPDGQCGAGSNANIKEWAPDEPSNKQADLYGDIKQTIEHQSCCHIVPTASSAKMIVGYRSSSSHNSGFTRGQARRDARAQKACSRKEVFSSNYQINCDQLKADGVIQCPQIPDAKPIDDREESRRNPGTEVSKSSNPAKRSNPFQVKSGEIDIVKFPKISDKQQCPRKVLIRTTFVTNKAGQVEFKQFRSHKQGEPFSFRATAKKISGKWRATHERVITVKKSINRSFMAQSTNKGLKARVTPWKKLVIRCDKGHSGSGDLDLAD